MMGTEKEVEAFVQRMGKRLSDNAQAPHGGRHRAAFIALRPLIEGALAHGYTMKATWAALREEKRLSMSYQTFRAHCRSAGLGQGAQAVTAGPRLGADAPRATGVAARPAVAGAAEAQERGFRHERVPRKGDIYG